MKIIVKRKEWGNCLGHKDWESDTFYKYKETKSTWIIGFHSFIGSKVGLGFKV